MTYATIARRVSRAMTGEEKTIVFASSLGALFEWYDFYLYGWTATQLGKAFYTAFDANTQFIFALLTFSVGFVVRPLGALMFGRLGDVVGRKPTFLVTIVIMGLSTFMVGLLPGFATLGWLAPCLLLGLRVLQGLAIGGEYGGAAIYVAEHAPRDRRGYYTAWIQTTATVGLLVSLFVVFVVRNSMSAEAFSDVSMWGGWRIPYFLSLILLGVSVWMRLRLNESPVFLDMKRAGRQSDAPLSEAFGHWKNARIAVIAVFGLTAGQAAVWYCGQFYTRVFLVSILRAPPNVADVALIVALLVATGGFLFFGALSDRVGRKPIVLAGCLLAALTYLPAFGLLTHAVNPALEAALARSPVTVVADPADCDTLFDPTGARVFRSPCDVAREALAAASVNFRFEKGAPGEPTRVKVGALTLSPDAPDPAEPAGVDARLAAFRASLGDAVAAAGYPVGEADAAAIDKPLLVLVLVYLALLVTMVYGPMAAALVELFPTRIRFSGVSLPYQIGNGWFGGLLPPVSVALAAGTGNIYAGLLYPIAIAGMTAVVGFFFLPETRGRDIRDVDG